MGFADIGYNAYGGANYVRKSPNLTEMIGTHLHHRRAVVFRQSEQGKGYAGLVVKVALILQGVKPLGQHACDKFLGGGLANAACNAYYRYIKPRPIRSRYGAESFLSGTHPYNRAVPLTFFMGKRRHGALFHCGSDKVMPVKPLAHNGHKQAARLYSTAVYGYAVYFCIEHFGGAIVFPAGYFSYLF